MMQVPVPQQRSSSWFSMTAIFADLVFLPVVKGLGCRLEVLHRCTGSCHRLPQVLQHIAHHLRAVFHFKQLALYAQLLVTG